MNGTATTGSRITGINAARIGITRPVTGSAELSVRALRVGVISDTHGLLRPEARAFLIGCDYILHGGDIGGEEILDELALIAPVIAVRGNNDSAPWAKRLADTELIRVGNIFVYMIHNLAELDLDPGAAGARVIVSGHSHKPSIEERDGILYFNPGSCGPRRFKLPICLGELGILGDAVSARIVNLSDGAPAQP